MKILNVVQGSQQWIDARLGIPTASNFKRIVTQTTLKASSSQDKYRAELLGEWFTGQPVTDFDTGFMERGREMEPDAANWYAFTHDVDAAPVGLCLTDDGKVGASPDRLVGTDGALEVKCPGLVGHLGYMANPASLTADYWCQVQGQLWVTRRWWCDIMSYHPNLPKVVVRVNPCHDFFKAFPPILSKFVGELDAAKATLEPEREKYRAQMLAQQPGERDIDNFGTHPTAQTPESFAGSVEWS